MIEYRHPGSYAAAVAPAVGQGICATCRHFGDGPSELEAALPGLRSLGSAFGSPRGADGVCRLHELYLAATSRCPQHARA